MESLVNGPRGAGHCRREGLTTPHQLRVECTRCLSSTSIQRACIRSVDTYAAATRSPNVRSGNLMQDCPASRQGDPPGLWSWNVHLPKVQLVLFLQCMSIYGSHVLEAGVSTYFSSARDHAARGNLALNLGRVGHCCRPCRASVPSAMLQT